MISWSFVLFSCQTDEYNGLDEGVITYKIEYLDYDENSIWLNILPETMTVAFKDGHTKLQIEGLFGIFRFSQITDRKEDEIATLLKILDKRYIYKEVLDSVATGFQAMENLSFQKTGEIKMIAGYECQQILVAAGDSVQQTFPIYYSNDIAINRPNIGTPFYQINEVLLEFQLSLNDIRMQLTATSVKEQPIATETFEIPAGYQPADRKEMEEIIRRFNDNESV